MSRLPPWSRIGKAILPENSLSVDLAMSQIGINWEVEKEKLLRANGTPVEHYAIVRKDKDVPLGFVGADYKEFQNTEAFSFFQSFLDNGVAKLETGGVINEGQKVWMCAKLSIPDAEVLPGDLIRPFIVLNSSHDGSRSLSILFSKIRMICTNQLTSATKQGIGVKIRHTGSVKNKIDNVKLTMDLAKQDFKKSVDSYKFLTTKKYTKESLLEYFIKTLQIPVKDNEISARSTNTLIKLTELMQKGAGSQITGVAGTWYSAYNAVTDYLTHSAGRSDEGRLNNLWFNDGTLRRSLSESLRLASI